MKVIAILFALTAQLLFAATDLSAATPPAGIHQQVMETGLHDGRNDFAIAQAKPKEDEDEDDDEIDEDDC